MTVDPLTLLAVGLAGLGFGIVWLLAITEDRR